MIQKSPPFEKHPCESELCEGTALACTQLLKLLDEFKVLGLKAGNYLADVAFEEIIKQIA